MISPCPCCGSTKLKSVFYCTPALADPDFWTWDDSGYTPKHMLKRIECAACGATTPDLATSADEAIRNWNKHVNNHRNVLLRIREFPINTAAFDQEGKA